MRLILSLAAAAALVPACAQAAVTNCSSLDGAIVDAAGDPMTSSVYSNVGSDLTCVDIDIVGDVAVFTASLADFDPLLSKVNFNLDTDQDPSTGYPGTTTANTDADILGIEHSVVFDLRVPRATVNTFVGPGLVFEQIALTAANLILFEDGFQALLPLALFADLPDWNFKSSAQVWISSTGGASTGIFDFASEPGAAPGVATAVSEVPLPAAALLFPLGLLGFGALKKRRAKA